MLSDVYYLQRQADNGSWLTGMPSYDLAMLINLAQSMPGGVYRITYNDEVVWMS